MLSSSIHAGSSRLIDHAHHMQCIYFLCIRLLIIIVSRFKLLFPVTEALRLSATGSIVLSTLARMDSLFVCYNIIMYILCVCIVVLYAML